MPVYEYRCEQCASVSTHVSRVADRPAQIECEQCGATAVRIISSTAVKLSSASKVARLDPKYDKMADAAMRATAHADPNRLLKQMKPFGKPD